jgi:hypothetical protein
MGLMRIAMLMTAACLLAACSTMQGEPATVSGLRSTVGTDLIGARGATRQDQRKIDRTVAGLCGGGIWTAGECQRHGQASRQ